MGDDRPTAYTEGKVSVYRASGVGSCLTALVASKLNYKAARPDFQEGVLSRAAGEGNLHEPAIIETLKSEHGWRVWGGQDEYEVKVVPGIVVRGHIDGLCIPAKARNDRGLEIKTMSKDRFKKWMNAGSSTRARLMHDDFTKYAWQLSVYMQAVGLPFMYVVKNRDSGDLDIGEVKIPPVPWKTVRKRLIEAEMWAKRGELPPCVASPSDRFFCEYPYLHDLGDSPFGDEPEDDEPVFDTATEALLSGMAEHYLDLAQQVSTMKPLDDERKGVGKKIIEAMAGSKKANAGAYSITRVDGNRPSVDVAAAAKKLGIDETVLKAALDDTMRDGPYSYVRIKKEGR